MRAAEFAVVALAAYGQAPTAVEPVFQMDLCEVRAQQIGVIRGILERLAEDDNVVGRVRKRARLLLALGLT